MIQLQVPFKFNKVDVKFLGMHLDCYKCLMWPNELPLQKLVEILCVLDLAMN